MEAHPDLGGGAGLAQISGELAAATCGWKLAEVDETIGAAGPGPGLRHRPVGMHKRRWTCRK